MEQPIFLALVLLYTLVSSMGNKATSFLMLHSSNPRVFDSRASQHVNGMWLLRSTNIFLTTFTLANRSLRRVEANFFVTSLVQLSHPVS